MNRRLSIATVTYRVSVLVIVGLALSSCSADAPMTDLASGGAGSSNARPAPMP